MATFRYTCACYRYMSPTRLGTTYLHSDLSRYPHHTHSAPSSPVRWRSSTTTTSTPYQNVVEADRNQQQPQATTGTSNETLHKETNDKTPKRSSILLKIHAVTEGLREVREWTAENTPKVDSSTMAKLVSTLNIDLPKYQQLLTKKARTMTANQDEDIERVRREQLNEKRARLFKKMDKVHFARETHDFGEAMKNTHESIHNYHSTVDLPGMQVECKSKTDQKTDIVNPESWQEKENPTILTKILSNTTGTKFWKQEKKETQQEVITKEALDRRTRGLVATLKEATTSSSTLHRLEDLCLHLSQYTKYGKNVAIQEKAIPLLLNLRKSRDVAISKYSLQALNLLGHVQPIKGRGVRILSIDGGGTRGLVAMEMLRQIETAAGRPIYEMFDYICGVSTGALLAIMLGAFQKPMDECEALYKEFSSRMFTQNKIQGVSKLVTTHAYYDTQLWEKILQENIGLENFIDTMKDEKCPKLCVVSALVNQKNMENFLFRNYTHATGIQSKYDGSIKYHLWEAIRASSAAPGYYEEFKLGTHIHQDGGLLTNNPGAVAIHEAKLLWPDEKLQCVVSVGTGRYRPMEDPEASYNLKDKLLKVVQSATDTEAVHTILHDLLPPATYFRFNPYMSDDFLLDEISEDRWKQMREDTLMYCRKNEEKIIMASTQLNLRKMSHQRMTEWIRIATNKMK